MSEIADRYRRIAAAFTDRATAVPAAGWDAPAPCEGWVARDVVRHMVEWMPSVVFTGTGLAVPDDAPSVDDDPAGAWLAFDGTVQSGLDDPEIAMREVDMRMGTFTYEQAVANFCIADVLVHTWDLARATGLDETLDADEVHGALAGMESVDELLRSSGHYGPKVEVAEDADEQTRLIAFTGRRP